MNRSAFDVAAVWLNMVKILIGLVFVYQTTLQTQLHMDLLQSPFYVFSTIPITLNGNGQVTPTSTAQHVTDEAPYFEIAILPLAISKTYETVAITISKITLHDDPSINQSKRRISIPFDWPTSSNGAHAMKVVRFDFPALIKDGSPAGLYDVYFEVNFKLDETEKPDNISFPPSQQRADKEEVSEGNFPHSVVRVNYQKSGPEPVGAICITRCQTRPFTKSLRGKWLIVQNEPPPSGGTEETSLITINNLSMTFTASRHAAQSEPTSEDLLATYQAIHFETLQGDMVNGTLNANGTTYTIQVDIRKLSSLDKRRFQKLQSQAPRDREMAYFTADGDLPDTFWKKEPKTILADKVEFHANPTVAVALTFLIEPNRPPRPIYNSPLTYVYDPDDRYVGPQGYHYLLNKFVVDPDRSDGSVAPSDIYISNMTNNNYSIKKTGENIWLEITDARRVSVNSNDQLELVASDGCSSSELQFVIRRTNRPLQ